jgi:hypothetical protein
MEEFIRNHLAHVLAGLLLIARLGDIGSTFLVSPSLKLEANPIVRKLGWRFAVLTLLVCLVPYWSVEMGVAVLVPSLLVSASNIGKVWVVRAYGEAEYAALLVELARRSKLRHALGGLYASCAFVLLAGVVLLMLAGGEEGGLAHWFGIGVVLYAFVVALHGSFAYRRIFRTARGRAA